MPVWLGLLSEIPVLRRHLGTGLLNCEGARSFSTASFPSSFVLKTVYWISLISWDKETLPKVLAGSYHRLKLNVKFTLRAECVAWQRCGSPPSVGGATGSRCVRLGSCRHTRPSLQDVVLTLAYQTAR